VKELQLHEEDGRKVGKRKTGKGLGLLVFLALRSWCPLGEEGESLEYVFV